MLVTMQEIKPADPAAQVAEIRAILAAFDWEHDDRQPALEAIDRIVGTDS